MFEYDDRDAISILNYAKGLKGKTFRNIMEDYSKSKRKSYINLYDNFKDLNSMQIEQAPKEYKFISSNAKGQVGNILEQCAFGYKPNGKQEADFVKAGVELKQTCIDKKKNGKLTAGERLSITNISYKEKVTDDFYKSHVWEKIKLILLIHYYRNKEIDRLDNVIAFVNLFTPTEKDLKIIIDDYNKIISKIKAGLAHELSEGDTYYLGACTKGATAEKSKQPQYYGTELAKKRNFCFKRSYMDYILNEYVLKNEVPFKLAGKEEYVFNCDLDNTLAKKVSTKKIESIITDIKQIKNLSFEDYTLNLINKYLGKTDEELCKIFDYNFGNNKSFFSNLVFRMLGVTSNQAEEFIKAGIVVKTIRVEKNGHIKEHMSFPRVNLMELAKETWENSVWRQYLSETKFLFVVFKAQENKYVLSKAMYWNMPLKTLESTVKFEWTKIVSCLNDGIKFKVEKDRVTNNLPNAKNTQICHMRPHTQNSAYQLNDGFTKGDINKCGDLLPNGEYMTIQCFWLNNKFIEKVINDEIY